MSDDDSINFALGDWIIKTDEWFGKDTGIKWIQELSKLKGYMNHLLALTGATLIQLQFLEYQVKACCAFIGLELTVADLFSYDPKRTGRTLGRLIRALRNKIAFDETFSGRLRTLVENRNRFAHNFWAGILLNSSESVPSIEILNEAERFISDLLREAVELQAPFRGLYYAIGKEMAERANWNQNTGVFIELAKYEKDFSSVLMHNLSDNTTGH